MQAKGKIFHLPVKLRRAVLLLGTCLLCLSQRKPPDPGVALPGEIKDRLERYQEKDDLSGWIYCQIQWVARSPAARALQLTHVAGNAWRDPRSNEEKQAWQDLLVNEGWACLLSGDIVRSTDAYTAAFDWARQHRELVEESQVLENILKPLGNNYTRLGDYEQALFIHQKALSIATALGDKDALAGTYSNLANTASNMGMAARSLDYCRQGLKIADPHSALCGLLLSEQADAYAVLRQDIPARISVQKSISILEQRVASRQRTAGNENSGYWLYTAYQQAGDIYSAQPRTALNYYNRALDLQTRLSQQPGAIRKREQAKLFQRLGALYFRTGRTAKALTWLDRCLWILIPGKDFDSVQAADLYAENTLVDLLDTRAELFSEQGQPDQALRLYSLCFATEKKLRNELVTGSSKEQSVTDIRSRYEEAIHTAWTAWENTGQNKYRRAILAFMESSKAQLLLVELLQQQIPKRDSAGRRIRLLEQALIYYRKEALQAGGNDSVRQLMDAQAKQITWDLAQSRKGSGSAADDHAGVIPDEDLFSYSPDPQILFRNGGAIRSFFAGSQALYTIELDDTGIRFAERLPLSQQWQDSLRVFTSTWFQQGAGKMIDSPAVWYGQAFLLYRQLFGGHPLQEGKGTILIPDGALSLLPADALVTEPRMPPSPEKWPFLIRQVSLSYAWSLSTLQQQYVSPANTGGISGFFISGDNRDLPSLQAIGQEKEGMAEIIKTGNWYAEDQATTASFRKALGSSSIVHISSHAFTGKDTLDAPHIELFDEPFYLFEAKDPDRHPALVVLSACRTGDGRMVTGEGAQSLARAFTAGGANAVISGWWNVNDVTAAQLIRGFYAALISSPDAAEALRRSKLNWLDDPQTSYLQKLPYYWAALNYQGNPSPLRDSRWSYPVMANGVEKRPAWWWLIGIAGAATGLILLMRRRR